MSVLALPLVGAGVTAVGIALAFIIAWRSRTIARPKLSVSFRFVDRAYPTMPKRRLRGLLPHAIFIHAPNRVCESDLHVPIAIRNRSRRPLNKVVVELIYPHAFFLSNQEIGRRTAVLLDMFGVKHEADAEAAQRFISTRQVSPLGPAVQVRYELGSLTPGEPFVFSEIFVLPEKKDAFDAALYNETAFRHVLAHMRNEAIFRAAFRLDVAILSELMPPQIHGLDIVLCAGDEDGEPDPLASYAEAYWLGSYPAGQRFIRRNPFSRRNAIREVPVDLIKIERDVTVSPPKDDVIAVARRPNPLKSLYGIASLCLPGYDPRGLSDEVQTAEEALRRIGFASAGKNHPVE